MRVTLLAILFSICSNATLLAQDQQPKLVTWQEIAAWPLPAPDHKLQYGPDSLQFGELRLPEGKGPFPVVVVVHGGCWLSAYNLNYMSHVSDALTKEGYATWNIEFRRVGDAGGGYPGTFRDVAMATDFVRDLAKKYPVDARNVAVMGHSAGGHLALWLAARKGLSRKSDLYTKKPLKLKGVIALAGIPDLATYSMDKGSCNAAVEKLMDGMPGTQQDRYWQASPAQLLPLGVKQRLVQGANDPIVPVTQSQEYAKNAKAKGDDAQVILLKNTGHFDVVAPQAAVWPTILAAVKDVLPVSSK